MCPQCFKMRCLSQIDPFFFSRPRCAKPPLKLPLSAVAIQCANNHCNSRSHPSILSYTQHPILHTPLTRKQQNRTTEMATALSHTTAPCLTRSTSTSSQRCGSNTHRSIGRRLLCSLSTELLLLRSACVVCDCCCFAEHRLVARPVPLSSRRSSSSRARTVQVG